MLSCSQNHRPVALLTLKWQGQRRIPHMQMHHLLQSLRGSLATDTAKSPQNLVGFLSRKERVHLNFKKLLSYLRTETS